MKHLAAVILTLACAAIASAEYYSVYVKRIDQDLYAEERLRVYFQTRYCHELTFGEHAVLKYEPYALDNKLLFDSGTECDIVKVLERRN